MEIKELYHLFLKNPAIQTDTRKLRDREIFFALKGPNFNGNLFAQQALEKGAAAVIVDEEIPVTDDKIIPVADTLKTLQSLASFHRDQIKIPVIAITGSNGKTTTKELLHGVLSTQYKTYTTTGNLNNHIGVPLTILKIKSDAEMAVVEMGANHLGEIASYCAYAKPTHGLITNIGKAHLEGFGSAENVQRGKGELFTFIHQNGGVAFVNADDEKVRSLAGPLDTQVLYGHSLKPATGRLLQHDPFLTVEITGKPSFTIETKLVGNYNLSNVLAAVCVGRYFRISHEKIKSAIESYQPSNSRSQMIQKGSNTFIMDAYNANPGSMKAAIENFATLKGDAKILVLGDMKELGNDSLHEHEELVKLIGKYSWKAVALTGIEFSKIKHPYIQFTKAEETAEWFGGQNFQHAQILIKGSRSMQMEKVLPS